MKTNIYSVFAAIAVSAFSLKAVAQQKVKDGTVTGSSSLPHAGAIQELESSNRGQLLPRVALTSTSVWGLNGTPVAGMQVYNTNSGITAGSSNYPIIQGATADKDGLGTYFWDGSGWVASRITQSSVPAYYDWLKSGGGLPTDPGDNSTNIYHQAGSVAVGNTAPSHRLHVTATSGSDPVRLEGLRQSEDPSDKMVVTTGSGVLKYASVSAPATMVIGMSNGATVFRTASGGNTPVPNDYVISNGIISAAYNDVTNTVSLPAGTYLMTFSFNIGQFDVGASSIPNPVTHSYFFDFPNPAGGFSVRLHSNQATHTTGSSGSHGGSISYSGRYTNAVEMIFRLGWGQGGAMPVGSSINLTSGTQLVITRIGD